MLKISDLHVNYGRREIVHGVTMSVAEGETVGLVAPNGAGKTTVLRAISGLASSSGELVYNGASLTGLDAWDRTRLGIRYVGERDALFPTLSVKENVRIAWRGVGVSKSNDIERTLADVGLAEKVNDRAGDLSGGQQRLLTLAMVSAGPPGLLLLDEPFAGVMPEVRKVITRYVRHLLNNKKQLATILIDHDLANVWEIADRIVVMGLGCVVGEVSTSDGGPEILTEMF